MTVDIRRANPGDAEILATIAAETFPLACPPSTTRASIDDFISRHLTAHRMSDYLADPDRVLFLASADDESVGYAMLVFGDPSDTDVAAAVSTRPTAELSKLYVREGFHGLGIASQLVAAAIDAARKGGVLSTWLGVNQRNARANRFYQKTGFALVGTKHFLVGDRFEDDYVREFRL